MKTTFTFPKNAVLLLIPAMFISHSCGLFQKKSSGSGTDDLNSAKIHAPAGNVQKVYLDSADPFLPADSNIVEFSFILFNKLNEKVAESHDAYFYLKDVLTVPREKLTHGIYRYTMVIRRLGKDPVTETGSIELVP